MPKEKNKDIFNTGYYISLTGKYIKLTASKGLRDNNLNEITLEQYGLLFVLSVEDGLYQRQISKALLKDRPNITRMLSILEKIGLVERRQDKDNKRRFKIFLTDKGKKEVERLIPIRNHFFEKAFKGISNEEVNTLLDLLEKVRNNLEDNFTIQI